jgi:hypothetical protein
MKLLPYRRVKMRKNRFFLKIIGMALVFASVFVGCGGWEESGISKTPHKITGVEQVGPKNLNIFFEGDIVSGEFRVKGQSINYEIMEFYFTDKNGKSTFVVVVSPNLTVEDKITITAANAEGSAEITIIQM